MVASPKCPLQPPHGWRDLLILAAYVVLAIIVLEAVQ